MTRIYLRDGKFVVKARGTRPMVINGGPNTRVHKALCVLQMMREVAPENPVATITHFRTMSSWSKGKQPTASGIAQVFGELGAHEAARCLVVNEIDRWQLLPDVVWQVPAPFTEVTSTTTKARLLRATATVSTPAEDRAQDVKDTIAVAVVDAYVNAMRALSKPGDGAERAVQIVREMEEAGREEVIGIQSTDLDLARRVRAGSMLYLDALESMTLRWFRRFASPEFAARATMAFLDRVKEPRGVDQDPVFDVVMLNRVVTLMPRAAHSVPSAAGSRDSTISALNIYGDYVRLINFVSADDILAEPLLDLDRRLAEAKRLASALMYLGLREEDPRWLRDAAFMRAKVLRMRLQFLRGHKRGKRDAPRGAPCSRIWDWSSEEVCKCALRALKFLDASAEFRRLTANEDGVRIEGLRAWFMGTVAIADKHDPLTVPETQLRETAQRLCVALGISAPTESALSLTVDWMDASWLLAFYRLCNLIMRLRTVSLGTGGELTHQSAVALAGAVPLTLERDVPAESQIATPFRTIQQWHTYLDRVVVPTEWKLDSPSAWRQFWQEEQRQPAGA